MKISHKRSGYVDCTHIYCSLSSHKCKLRGNYATGISHQGAYFVIQECGTRGEGVHATGTVQEECL